MLANSVDEFTTCLLDPLKSHKEDRRAFDDSLDDVIDAGISLEQKKVTAFMCDVSLRGEWVSSGVVNDDGLVIQDSVPGDPWFKPSWKLATY